MTDLALALKRHGYGAIELERGRSGGDTCFETRLLGRRAVVLGGREGARLFYDEAVVRRRGAVAAPLASLLFGQGAVHGMDGEPHRERKRWFLDRLGPEQVGQCARRAGTHLRESLADRSPGELRVHPALVSAYGRAVLAWAGVPGSPRDLDRRARQYADIVAGFGFAPAAYAKAWRARILTDRWARALVRDVRHGRVPAAEGTVLRGVADADLDESTAAVELGNVLRPTIAVAWLGTFAVLALDAADGWRDRLASDDQDALRWSFAQEVRRTSPFVPALAGVVTPHVVTRGDVALRRGDRVVLDVPGINHDPVLHRDPHHFRADRFVDVVPDPYELVPQGGGLALGHRCPGESLALQLLVATVRAFAPLEYEVRSDRGARLTTIPTLPDEGLRIAVR